MKLVVFQVSFAFPSSLTRHDTAIISLTAGCADDEKVREVITPRNIQGQASPQGEILDEIALALDGTSLVLGNWFNLAMKLSVPRNACWKLGARSTESPTNRLFQYLETTRPHMTLTKLKDALDLMTRYDLLEVIEKENLEGTFNEFDLFTDYCYFHTYNLYGGRVKLYFRTIRFGKLQTFRTKNNIISFPHPRRPYLSLSLSCQLY